MKIVSRFPYVWPHLGFALVAGENEIEESKIPLAAHAKLVHLSKPGLPVTVVDVDKAGNKTARSVPTPAPISGYEPSNALAKAAEAHARKSAVKQQVQTLETLQAQPAAEGPKEPAKAPEPKRGEQR